MFSKGRRQVRREFAGLFGFSGSLCQICHSTNLLQLTRANDSNSIRLSESNYSTVAPFGEAVSKLNQVAPLLQEKNNGHTVLLNKDTDDGPADVAGVFLSGTGHRCIGRLAGKKE